MPTSKLALALFLCTGFVAAQNLPAGTALPVAVGTTLTAKSSKAGGKIDGKLMQDVRLPSGAVIKSGAHVSGHVVSAKKPGAGGSNIVLQFDQLHETNTLRFR